MSAVAMVLAAGLGTRIRAAAPDRPKPMIEVAGRTLIDRVLDRLAAAGVARAVVNLHYQGERLAAHLAGRERPVLAFSREAVLQETGGGVRDALPLLGQEPFLVVNSDILWTDGPGDAIRALVAAWCGEDMDALLLLHRTVAAHGYEGRGDFFLAPTGEMRRRRPDEVAPLLFAGIQVLHPRIFAAAPVGPFSLNRLYDTAEAAGRLHGVVHDGAWFHVGTPDGLAVARRHFGD